MEHPAPPGRGSPEFSNEEVRIIVYNNGGELPGLTTDRSIVFGVRNPVRYWSALAHSPRFSQDLGVFNLADYGLRLATAICTEADMERKFKMVAKGERGDRNRRKPKTSRMQLLCAAMLRHEGVGHTLWDKDASLEPKDIGLGAIWASMEQPMSEDEDDDNGNGEAVDEEEKVKAALDSIIGPEAPDDEADIDDTDIVS